MDRKEFGTHMTRLFSYYGREPTVTLLQEWYKEFGNLPENAFYDAVTDAITERKSPPTLAEMKGHVRKHDPRTSWQPGRARAQTTPFEGDEKDVEFSRRVAPEFFKLLSVASKRGRNGENVERMFRHFIAHARGVAMDLGILNRIDWAEFDGQFGCEMPGAWKREESTDADHDQGSPGNDGRV
jgi:hypothetical protein